LRPGQRLTMTVLHSNLSSTSLFPHSKYIVIVITTTDVPLGFYCISQIILL
jgi:hypothetical protein